MNKKNIAWIGLSIVTVLGLAYWFSQEVKPIKTKLLPYYTHDAAHNKMLETHEPGNKVTAFSFTNQQSDDYTDKEVKGAIYIADYFFVTCPGICKQMGSQLQRVYATYEHEPKVKILSHT